MNRSPVVNLGYLVIYSEELDVWREFSTGVLGMSSFESADNLLLRMDERVARMIVSPTPAGRPAGVKGPYAVGWECRSYADWSSIAKILSKEGVEVTALPETAWYTEAFSCVDPAGVQCEFFYGGKVDPANHFVSPTGVRFVTGGQGLGHVTISTPHCRESVDFYSGLLGFQIRETKFTGPERRMRWAFLSPSEREHSIAVMDTGRDGQLMHVLIEVTDLDSVGRVMDKCYEGLAPMSVSLGRHWNDEMVSFYVRTPSGFDVEYGCGGRTIDSGGWSHRAQGGSGAVSLWGHRVIREDGTLGSQIGSGH